MDDNATELLEQSTSEPQDVAEPTEEVVEEAEEQAPSISIDKDGNLDIGEEFLEYEGQAEEPEAEPEEQPEAEQPKEELFKVKVDGEEVEVTLDELLNGYSRQKDYTKKTMKVAEERKELEAQKAEIGEALKSLDMSQRYGVNITPDMQKNISKQADQLMKQRYGDNVDELSADYQDARSVMVNQLTSQYSEQVKAGQRMEKAQQYLRQREPNFDAINQEALRIAQNEMNVSQYNRLQQAQAMGDPAPLLEVFDVARQRFYQKQHGTADAQSAAEQTAPEPVEPRAKTPEPPKTESGGGSTGKPIQQPKVDLNGFGHLSAAQQTKALMEMGLID